MISSPKPSRMLLDPSRSRNEYLYRGEGQLLPSPRWAVVHLILGQQRPLDPLGDFPLLQDGNILWAVPAEQPDRVGLHRVGDAAFQSVTDRHLIEIFLQAVRQRHRVEQGGVHLTEGAQEAAVFIVRDEKIYLEQRAPIVVLEVGEFITHRTPPRTDRDPHEDASRPSTRRGH